MANMAPKQATQGPAAASRTPKKMPKLPANARVTKRPIMRPGIPSPHAGALEQKVVYVSSKMPFMSAVKRVKQLLKHVDKREMQAILSKKKKKSGNGGPLESDRDSEPIVLKATGKAISKALSLAHFFQKQREFGVVIKTSSVAAIDDIELEGEDVEMDEEVPESRIRHASVVEVYVTAR